MPALQSEASGLIDIRAMAAATLSSNHPGGPSMNRGPDMLLGADVAPVFAPVATNMLIPAMSGGHPQVGVRSGRGGRSWPSSA